MEVIKRDGRKVNFSDLKIFNAISKAFFANKFDNYEELGEQQGKAVLERISNEYKENDIITIEDIQNIVELVLMKDYPLIAKDYIIYRDKRSRLRINNSIPKEAISDYMFASKYSKFLDVLERREVFDEIVDRNMFMHINKFPFLEEEIKEAYEFVRQKKIMPSMRSMQFAGSAIEAHNARMFNCSFTLVDRFWVFREIFYLLLCGCGVGYSVQKQHVDKLPELGVVDKKLVYHYTIPDSIEGWANSVHELVRSYLAGYYIEFDYSRIRPQGKPLRTSGGVAPGHLPLKRCLENCRVILDGSQGRKLKTLECSDIICHIAMAVLSGGIRRSSTIAIFSYDDDDMFYAKSKPNYDPANGVNIFRAMANFTAALLRKTVTRDQFDRIIRTASDPRTGMGEPAFAFLPSLDYGLNPCGEAGLNPMLFDLLRKINNA